jgi:AcrR family transcriptional regulator
VPGLTGDHGVERSSGRIPFLELGDFDGEAVTSRELGHARVDLDPQHLAAHVHERSGGEPGADPDIEKRAPGAAERVLLRDGPSAVTSRAVTSEARLAKGVLHSHFPDFDTFLASLVLSHLERLEALGEELRESVGAGTVQASLSRTLAEALTPPTLALVSLAWSRHELLERLRLTTPTGIPLLTETTRMITGYLTAERGLGRIPLDTDVDSLAIAVVGGAQLMAADHSLRADELDGLVSAASGD